MTWRARDAIADTSVLLYLHCAGKLGLLEALFRGTLVPDAVHAELGFGAEIGIDVPDEAALRWTTRTSATPEALALVAAKLGSGEREVLAVGVTNERSIVLLDDAAARSPVIDNIVVRGFRIDAATRTRVLRKAGELC